MSFELIAALYLVCSDYHSGQWSRGYRILSRITRQYKPRNIDKRLLAEPDIAELYRRIVENYANKL